MLDALDQQPTTEPYALMARLMYGAGLRQMECCRLRVKDIDLERNQLTVRQGKGDKDRIVMLPQAARPALEAQLRWRAEVHQRDLDRGLGWVSLTNGVAGVRSPLDLAGPAPARGPGHNDRGRLDALDQASAREAAVGSSGG